VTAPFVVAALFFVIVVTLVVGLWWVLDSRRALRQRLGTTVYQVSAEIIRSAQAHSGLLGSL
jgi:hypothetical protein